VGKETRLPKIGVNVLVFNGDLLLLGLRRRSGRDGMWCPPGGHLHWQESVSSCARREVLEETGLSVRDLRCVGLTNDTNSGDGRHYLSLFFVAG
jgi:8-oxo-dGTP diphosphatase